MGFCCFEDYLGGWPGSAGLVVWLDGLVMR